VTAWHCLKHAVANREWARKYSGSVRRNKTLTYRLATEAKAKGKGKAKGKAAKSK
jgi:hypothetical protein